MLGSNVDERRPRKFSDQARANMAAAHRGRPHSLEHRAAIAAACTPERMARTSRAALEAIERRLAELGAIKLVDALEARGIDYATGYEWATYRRSGQIRPPVFRGPRRILCVREAELDVELERWRCTWEGPDGQCTRYALLSETGMCHDHRAADVLRQYRRRAYQAVRNSKRFLLVSDVARKVGLSGPYITRALIPSGRLPAERRRVAGVWAWVVNRDDLRSFQRSRPANHWHDPEWVKRWALDHERDRALADKLGISRSQALDEILALVDARRRRPAGRPRRVDVLVHHRDWLDRFLAIRENYESHAYAGEPMPKPTRLCVEVAIEDYLEHPERWPDYEPVKEPKAASDRVWTAVKPLLIAESEIPGR